MKNIFNSIGMGMAISSLGGLVFLLLGVAVTLGIDIINVTGWFILIYIITIAWFLVMATILLYFIGCLFNPNLFREDKKD